jgi:hypothetical protein
LRVVLAEVRGQFENPEEARRPLLEAVTRKLVKTMSEYASLCVTVISKV